MTRVNVGIQPSELCDQHLLAEYRELPRAIGMTPKAKPPARFCLGPGHMTWCAQHQGSLVRRQCALVREMLDRGFRPSWPAPGPVDGSHWTLADSLDARRLLIARIRERLTSMKRKPTWTLRKPPEWARDLLTDL